MPIAALPNLAGAVEQPLTAIGSALANAPIQAADQAAALRTKGWQQIQPYVIAASRNPNLMQNNAFTSQMQRIAQMYRISGPLLDQAIQQTRAQLGGGGTSSTGPAGGAPAGGAVQTGPATISPAGGAPGAQAQPSPQSQPSPAGAPPSQPTTKPVGSSPDLGQHWDDPRLKQLSAIYQQDLEAAARTPALTGHPDFHQKIYLDGKKVGRNAQEIAADVKAYQLKAGTGPHDEHMPPDQAAIRQQRQQALSGTSPAGASGTSTTPTGATSSANPSPQASAVPPGTPGSGAEGPTHYDGPHALPPAMQALMAATGVAPSGMQAYGTNPIDAATSQRIAEAQPGDRSQLYANAGIDPTTVPNSVINAKPVMTEAQRGVEWQRIYGEAQGMVKEGEDPSGIIGAAMRAGVITTEMGDAFLSDPTVIGPMRDAGARNAGVLADNGLVKKAQYQHYQSEIATAQTTQDLNRIREKYIGKQIQNFDSLTAANVGRAWATVDRDDAEVTAIQNGTWFNQQTVQGRSLNDQIRDAQELARNTNQAYTVLFNAGQKRDPLTGQPVDPSQIDVGGGTKYVDALAQAKEAKDAAIAALNALKGGDASKQASTSTVQAASGQHVKGATGGKPPWQTPPQYKAQGYVPKLQNGVWVLKAPGKPDLYPQ